MVRGGQDPLSGFHVFEEVTSSDVDNYIAYNNQLFYPV